MKWAIVALTALGILIFAAVYKFSLTPQLFGINLESYNNLPANQAKIPEISLPSLSPQQIFSSDHDWLKSLPQEQTRVLTATGDIIPARSVNFQETARQSFIWPYEKTAQFLKNSDITFANLESPLIANCPVTQEGMIFCGDLKNIDGLKFAGVNVVSLANNHAGNHGLEGINNTINVLKNAGILVTGVNGPVFKDVRGIKFAFLGYNNIGAPEQGLSWAYPDQIQAEIKSAKSQADVVVVTFHWGTEYKSQPDPKQIELGHLAIDAGADLVIGNHPHWIQPIEIYHDKLITYAHGNFVFDQMWSQKTREGVVGRYTFYGKKLVDVQYLPVQIDDYGQPHFVDEPQKSSILNEMEQESQKLASLKH
ncbi:MAG: CapA family protein [Patescibacteria group bacterium]|nr:CapA family protein [Patescibacteria group bacterium]